MPFSTSTGWARSSAARSPVRSIQPSTRPSAGEMRAMRANAVSAATGDGTLRASNDQNQGPSGERFDCRVEEGRVTGTYWQPVVSLPRSSNWTCPFRTSSFPTGFTAAPTRAVHTTWCRATAPRNSRFALRHSGIERSSVLRGVVDSSSITALFPLSPAHQKQGSFPPPVLPSIHGTVTLSDFRTGHPPIEDVGGATSTGAGSPPITQTTFLTCRAQYPGGPNRCVSVSSLSARPSPFNGRVGIHNFTFEACSSFTRVTACKIARPPKGGLLSRGFDPASYPTRPLGSYHVLPTTTWMDPPSTGDLRRWGARRVEEGRWTGTYWQPVVSLPRSSNWTCP